MGEESAGRRGDGALPTTIRRGMRKREVQSKTRLRVQRKQEAGMSSNPDRMKEATSEVFHNEGVYAGGDEAYLFGRSRVSGPDPEHRSYRSFASFKDPDGNGWLFQELTSRLPGRIDSKATSFASVNDLVSALRRTAQ